MPSANLYGRKYDLLAVELKPPGGKYDRLYTDSVKLGKELKIMLDELVDSPCALGVYPRQVEWIQDSPPNKTWRTAPPISSSSFQYSYYRGQMAVKTVFRRLMDSQQCQLPSQAQRDIVVKPITRGGIDLEFLTRKEFRCSLLPCWKDLPKKYPRATATAWWFFWKMSIPHKAKYILYRYVHHVLPDRVTLRRLLPPVFDSDLCHICGQVESRDYILFLCSVKQRIWSTIAHQFLEHRRTLRYRLKKGWYIEWPHMVAWTVKAIWDAHWLLISDSGKLVIRCKQCPPVPNLLQQKQSKHGFGLPMAPCQTGSSLKSVLYIMTTFFFVIH